MRILLQKIIIFTFIFFVADHMFGNENDTVNTKIDSLKALIEKTSGKKKVNCYIELAKAYLSESPDEVINQAKKAYELSREILYREGLARALNRIGSGFYVKSNYDSAMFYYQKSLKLCQAIKNKQIQAKVLSNMGLIYDCTGNYNKALDYHLQSLQIEEEFANTKGIASTLNNIGNIYYFINDYKKSLEYFKKALELYQQLEDQEGVAHSFNNIGIIYQITNKKEKALLYLQSALVIYNELNNHIDMATCYNNIGNVYMNLNDYDNAIKNYNESIKISKSINDLWSLGNTYRNIGGVYFALNNNIKAKEYYNRAFKLAKGINANELLSNIYQSLYELYFKENKFKKALEYHIKHTELKDSLSDNKKNIKIAELELGYKLQEREKKNEIQQKENEIQHLNIAKSRNNIYLFIFSGIIILLLIILIYSKLKQRKKTNTLLEEKDHQIDKMNKKLKNYNEDIEAKVKQRTKNLEEDLKERERIDIELKKALKQAEDANYLKNAFLTNMSHEIRTPLNGIIGFSNLLITELSLMENEELYEYANGIQQSGERLLHLLDNIIDISRIEANDMDIDIKPCFINEIVKNVSELYSFKANDRGIKFNTKLNDIPKAIADEPILTKIISDIIDNAIKYTEKGFINVLTNYDKKRNKVIVTVKDTGIGIDKAYIGHIFEAFRQESLGYSRTHQGAGLGLPLAKRLMALMNGSIDIQSTKGVGTTVILSLEGEKEETEQIDENFTIKELKDKKKHEDLSIFIVEDDRMNRLVLTKMLSKTGKVVAAVDGNETMRIIKENYKKGLIFDVMLFDINLPAPWDGIKLMNEIKKNFKEYKNVPFIAQTAYAMTGDRERLLEAGFDNYIAKPINKREIINMINNQLKIIKTQ